MSDYSKMKNADLEALLKARNLPHTGKKADLVARLTEDDTQKASKAVPEDEIDWDDDDLPAPAKPAPATTATPAASASAKKEEAKAQPAAAKAAPASKADAPAPTAKTNGSATEPAATAPAEEATAAEPAPSFNAGLTSTSVDAELEKRRKRIERFRNPNDAASNELAEEELRKLARAAKYGAAGITEKVDAALPERQKRKRGDADDGGARPAPKAREGRRPARGADRGDKKDGAKQGSWMTDADRKKAEARKARFSAA